MGTRGLKTKIAVNITVFLLIGMLSIDLVTMMTAQRSLIRSEILRGKAVAALVVRLLSDGSSIGEGDLGPSPPARVVEAVDLAGVACLLTFGRQTQQVCFGGRRCAPVEDLLAVARHSLVDNSGGVGYLGTTFGFFWPQKEFMLLTSAFTVEDGTPAAFTLVFSLEEIYRTLRGTQHMLLLYILVNTAVLAFLGIYRVFKLYLQPLGRLAQRAEDYKEEDEILFAVRKEDNELQRLSSALNRLLRRLSAEKGKLKDSVASLERTNLELKKAQTEIVRAEKLASVGRLSAGIAHEIGNPIGIVTGYLELLKQEDLKPGERIEYLQRAETEIERISVIIRQLLEISRASQEGSTAVSVHALLGEMVDVIGIQPFMSHIQVQIGLGAGRDRVWADQNQLRQVFLNLIINAADAISSKGPGARGDLVITTENAPGVLGGSELPDAWLHVRFSDNGTGIPEENLAAIFDPFFTTKEPGKGTGLGLSVSFMISERFGGTIRVESEARKGTTMTVSLPVAGADRTGGRCPADAGALGSGYLKVPECGSGATDGRPPGCAHPSVAPLTGIRA
jgi:signal transduction histidine kinase